MKMIKNVVFFCIGILLTAVSRPCHAVCAPEDPYCTPEFNASGGLEAIGANEAYATLAEPEEAILPGKT